MLLVSFSNVRKEEKKKIVWREFLKGKGNVTRTFRCALDCLVQTSNPDAVLCNTCENAVFIYFLKSCNYWGFIPFILSNEYGKTA